MKVVAIRNFQSRVYGTRAVGDTFDCLPSVAKDWILKGLVRKAAEREDSGAPGKPSSASLPGPPSQQRTAKPVESRQSSQFQEPVNSLHGQTTFTLPISDGGASSDFGSCGGGGE